MAEPNHSAMHNFAYHPSVADWVHSTSLATQFDGTSDEPPEPSPDDFYKSAFPPTEYGSNSLTEDMTTTRQRQQTSNGAVRSTPKPALRSASGPATSIPATRSTPQLPGNRPTVKSLAQRFNHPSSTESSPSSARVRPARPVPSTRSATHSPAGSSPARPAKEASYGPHKFNNLKPRERPQPAPASPASMRRASTPRKSMDEQTSPTRRKISSPTRSRNQAAPVRQPFFGEVVGEHDAATPGFGIPTIDSTPRDIESNASPSVENPSIKFVTDDSPSSQRPFQRTSPIQPAQPLIEDAQSIPQAYSSPSREPRRRSPPSRIPVATRRMSAASDSSSSNRSIKGSSSRTIGGRKRASPVRLHKAPGGKENGSTVKPKPTTLPSVSYRDYRERGKTPQDARNGAGLAAATTNPPQPTSPRLRNSKERHLFPQGFSHSHPRPPGQHSSAELNEESDFAKQQPDTGIERSLEQVDQSKLIDVSTQGKDSQDTNNSSSAPTVCSPLGEPEDQEQGPSSMAHREPLTLHTSPLRVPQVPAPLSSTTDFEYDESPILGMPGSFMMTPPIAQQSPPVGTTQKIEHRSPEELTATSGEELLQPRIFQPQSNERPMDAFTSVGTEITQSELGIRESIPIMLGSDGPGSKWSPSQNRTRHSPRISIGATKWRAEPIDATGTISFLEEDDSPIDPFSNRETLRPDDSASVAFYRQADRPAPDWTSQMPPVPAIPDTGGLTLDSEAYSVINKVLNMYHNSDEITPDMADDSRKEIQRVSPIIAQHKDWFSKESTETYLARLLSDANGVEGKRREDEPQATDEQSVRASKEATSNNIPALDIHRLDEDPAEPHVGGTAIIYPPESRRYSRGSRGSTTTTIIDDGSRANSSSENLTRDRYPEDIPIAQPHHQPSAHAHYPPAMGLLQSTLAGPSGQTGGSPRASNEQSRPSFDTFLPEIQGTGDGLGLSLQAAEQQQTTPKRKQPPRPTGPPPPPPAQPSLHQRIPRPQAAAPPYYTPSVYSVQNADSSSSAFTHARDGVATSRTPGAPLPANYPDALHTEVAFAGDNPEWAENTHLPKNAPHIVTRVENGEKVSSAAFPDEDAEGSAQRLKRRYRILEELVHTEHMYSSDMMVIAEIWLGTASEPLPDPRDRHTLFSNVAELSKFSYQFWQDLKCAIADIVNHADPPKDGEVSDPPYDEFVNCTLANDDKTSVGYVIKEYLPQIERLYTTYLLNHDNANKLMKARQEDPLFIGWQMACVKGAQGITDAWDLDSLLVKPVQRLLKYPLILAELKQVTPPNHDDYEDICTAHKGVLDISDRINQAKKRQETLRAATSEGKKEKKKGFRGMGIVKALTSKTDQVKQQAGVANLWVDKEYDKVAQKFGGNFFQIQIIINDVENYRDLLTANVLQLSILTLSFVTMLDKNGPSSNPEIESAWRRNAMAFLELRNVLLEDHKLAVRHRVSNPLGELWQQYVRPEKLMQQRKKGLVQYSRYVQALDRKEKIDPKLEDAAKSFEAVNEALKDELPKLYALTKECVQACLQSFIRYQLDWWKNCQKKILPLLEYEPEHTTSFAYDLKAYTDRYNSDSSIIKNAVDRLGVCNGALMEQLANFQSPIPSLYADDTSSRKSSSRRTESIGSDVSMVESRHRRSGGYTNARAGINSFDGPPRSAPHGPAYPPPTSAPFAIGRPPTRDNRGVLQRDERAISPASEHSDATVTLGSAGRSYSSSSYSAQLPSLDGAMDDYNPPALASAFLSPSNSSSGPNSSRGSAVFTSALPMSDSPVASRSVEELPGTPADLDEPEVLFLAASLFEFNIAHDRREGGIPYLVYVPGEIFDVIGMKGELWLARNQDDPSRTVGWIWEKHFARILPEDN